MWQSGWKEDLLSSARWERSGWKFWKRMNQRFLQKPFDMSEKFLRQKTYFIVNVRAEYVRKSKS
jgi:thermostable 8-oxoguanine DNA glycosylase